MTNIAGADDAMIDALRAPGPWPGLEDKLQLFGQFVGSWDLERTSYALDGTSATVPGEWHFGWALEGRAIQDVWICPPRGQRTEPVTPPGEWGTASCNAASRRIFTSPSCTPLGAIPPSSIS